MTASRATVAAVVALAAGIVACGGATGRPPPGTAGPGATRTAEKASPAAVTRPGAHGRTALVRVLHHELRQAGRGSAAYVVDLTGHATLLAVRADVPHTPASVEKLYTSTALLRRLGAGAHLQTTLVGTGSLGSGGVWRGDLYLRGGGDPSLGAPAFNAAYEQGLGTTLDRLVRAVLAAGIRRVQGRVFGDESLLDTRRGGPSSGYRPDVLDLGGQLGALTFNHGSVLALLRPHGRHYVLSPAVDAAVELTAALRRAGVAARPARAPRTAPAGAVELGRAQSPALLDLLRLTNLQSDDFYAETLTKQLGVRLGGAGTTSAGARVVADTLSGMGIYARVADGSGLSRADATTPRQVVSLLAQAARTRWGAELLGTLPVAGESGTLIRSLRGTVAQGRCQAKTGTLIGVASLAGLCRSQGGQVVAFAMMLDGLGVTRAHAIRDAMMLAMVRDDPARL